MGKLLACFFDCLVGQSPVNVLPLYLVKKAGASVNV
jgi:hypothetical protein